MERGRKRSEASDSLPADKRPCSSSEFRTATATNDPSTSSHTMDTSTSQLNTSSSPMDTSIPELNTPSLVDTSAPQLNISTFAMDTRMDSVYSSDESDYDNNSEESHETPPASPRHAYNGRSDNSLHGNFKQILEGLEKNEPAEVAAALFQLCEALSFINEDSAGYIPVEKLVPLLVNIAGQEGQPDEMLLAVRAITYLCDAMPRSAESVVRHGAVPVLCGKLLSIEYLDLAEQCLQALEKISKKQPVSCLQAGSISAVLAYLDFFSPNIQRTAVSTVANMCKRVPPDCSSLIMESLPQLCNLLQYSDSKFVEMVATCLIRIVDSYSSSPELLDKICQCGMVERTIHLITVDGRSLLSRTTYMSMLALLTKLASRSLVAVKSLFEFNVGSTLKAIFMDFDLPQSVQYFHMDNLHFNKDYEVLKLVNQLIPSASKDLDDMPFILAKEKILTDQPSLFCQFSRDILPALIKVVNSGSNISVSYGCISVVGNIFYFSTPEMLTDLLNGINISSFLATLLAKKDHHILFSALKAVEVLMQKLPETFLSSFVKEGVVYAVDAILMQETCQRSQNQSVNGSTSECLCYTFAISRPSQTRSCHLRGLNKDDNGNQGNGTIHTFARQLKAKYFTHEAVSSEIGLSEISRKLKTCCQLLNDTIDTPPNEQYLSTVLGEVMKELCRGESMTTFEFVESGIVKLLANYLTNGKYLEKDLVCNSMSHDHFISVLKRLKAFAHLCFNKVCKESGETIMTFLVRRLQNALSSFDSFPVVLSHGFRHRPFRVEVPVRHNATCPCVKISFLREDDETELSEFDGGVLYVESTLSLAEIEKFLWPKICKKDCGEEKGSGEASTAGIIDASSSCSSEEVTSRERQQSASSADSLGENQTDNAITNEHAEPKLVFKLKGRVLSSSVTLYQSILDDQTSLEPDVINGPNFWNEVHKVTYRKAKDHQKDYIQQVENTIPSSPHVNSSPVMWHRVPFFSSLLKANLPCNLSKSSPSFDILFMLRTLEGLNRMSSSLLSSNKIYPFAKGRKDDSDSWEMSFSTIPQEEFISHKLTEKLEQQMRDPLASYPSGMPLWCKQLIEMSPFLFSFEARKKYFRLITFGQLPHNNSNDSNNISPLSPSGRSRDKFKVDRQNLFESAYKMMELKASNKAPLEVEYLDEVGTGLGPTIEFYTLISRELQKVGLGLWRGDLCGSNENQDYVAAPLGLFPRPWSVEVQNLLGVNFQDVHQKFVLLGQVVAKAIKDGRIVDIALSRAFYRAILEQELTIYDILSFDPELGRTLLEFQALVEKIENVQSDSKGNQASTSNLNYRGTEIEDLGIDFSLPGYAEYLLSHQNNTEQVSIENLKDYVKMVVEATTRAGICRQLEAFKSGFNQVFRLSALKLFTEDELEAMICGENVTWSFTELVDNIKFDHGYTANSPPVINLLEILQELESPQRKAFVQFITGSPRLPPGGLASLNPKLTVVRKHSLTDTDMELPSVMTCANYLKLPPYSSKEKMRQRLLYAIKEGQGSFHLS